MNYKSSILAAALMASVGSAGADVVHFASDAASTSNASWTGVSLEGSVEYTHTGASAGEVVFSVTNTTSSSIGGFLTGIVFNIGSADSNASATLISSSDGDFKNTGSEDANPFGTFDAGVALKGKWTGGGNPSKGIGAGLGGVFSFAVSASDAASLSAGSFVGDGSEIALRFRGLNNGASDKLTTIPNNPSLNVVPLPSGLMAGGAMLGLGLGVRRLRK